MKSGVNISAATNSVVKPAIFLDRDGVICEYKDEIILANDFILRPNAIDAIKLLNDHGYLIFIITNQPQIAKGKLSFARLQEQHNILQIALERVGAFVDKIYICPHRIGGSVKEFAIDCDCRKPKPGLVKQAMLEYSIDIEQSFLIGDTWRDLKCAKTCGLKILGIKGGAGFPYAGEAAEYNKQVDFLFESLIGAALHIVRDNN